jgi:RNase H-fold protein (predicted Holliday junction resolvase)
MKYLCLDLGTAHTGIAISEEGLLATPLTTIYEKKLDPLVGKLKPILEKNKPDVLVIGSPAHGPMVKYTQDLSDQLE